MVKTTKESGGKNGWIDFFSDNRLAIYSLITLCLVTLIGTIIPQRGPGLTEEVYHRLVGAGGFWAAADRIGFLEIFKSPWFLGAFLVLCLNLIFCTLVNFKRVYKTRTPKDIPLDAELLGRLDKKTTFKTKETDAREKIRKVRRFDRVEDREGETWFYEEFGSIHRYGAIITHIAVLVFAIGAIYGVLFGVDGSMTVAEGEKKDKVEMRVGDAEFELPFFVKCNDFKVEFYPDRQQPKTFRSDVTFTPKAGGEPSQQLIEVNKPGRYGGYRFFQSTYGQIPPQARVRIKRRSDSQEIFKARVISGKEISLPDDAGKFAVADLDPNRFKSGLAARVVEQLGNADPHDFWIFKDNPAFDDQRGGPFIYELAGVEMSGYYTGLMVAKNPGVNVVWLGSAIMALGIGLAFFVPYRKTLVRLAGDQITVGTQHSRGMEEAEESLNEIVEALGGKPAKRKST